MVESKIQIDLANNLAPITVAVALHTTVTIDVYQASNTNKRLLVFGHAINAALRGIYIVLTGSVVSPIVEATGITVTASSWVVIITNDTANGVNGIVMI